MGLQENDENTGNERLTHWRGEWQLLSARVFGKVFFNLEVVYSPICLIDPP